MASQWHVAGVVVLYNPGIELLGTIASYREQIDHLFVIDNSAELLPEVRAGLALLQGVTYCQNQCNAGMAAALNQAAELALAAGYDFLLTMDQDSSASPDMVARLVACLEGRDVLSVGMVSPFHMTRNMPPSASKECSEVLTVMTSGNLLNLAVFCRVGRFLEELFIDYVDHEYCLRLRQQGYQVLQDSSTLLEHSLGNIVIHDVGFKRFAVTNHSPLRRYYMTRNRFWVMRRYRELFPAYYREQLVAFLRELYLLVLFEDNKLRKFAMIIKGYRDYRRGKLGPYEAQR